MCESKDKSPSELREQLHMTAVEVPLGSLLMMKEAYFGG